MEQRIGRGEIVAYWIGAVDAQGAAFAQHQQAGGVVDLAVHENDADDPCVPQGATGCAAGKTRSCARMSGEALSSTQLAPSALTAMDDWVRGRALICPRRTPSQLRQLQFHCGNPPLRRRRERVLSQWVERDEQPVLHQRLRESDAGNQAAAGRAGRGRSQRVRTYIVISKPNLKSMNSGFVQAIMCSKAS